MTAKDYIVIADGIVAGVRRLSSAYPEDALNRNQFNRLLDQIEEALYRDNIKFNAVKFEDYINSKLKDISFT